MPKTSTQRTEIKHLSAEQLSGELETLRAKVLELRFEHANRSLKNTTTLATTRHAIARILTLQRQATRKQS